MGEAYLAYDLRHDGVKSSLRPPGTDRTAGGVSQGPNCSVG